MGTLATPPLDRFGRIELAGTAVRRPTFTLRGLKTSPVAP